jgi:DNA mismatch repair protein MutL
MTIRVLTGDVASKIAAGEVVERPASVVKELVENSLDAGATQVSVEVKGGGVELIRVADNGCGVESKEAALAFERHATSKLKDIEDLEQIGTLGFRGEALPSIASVSRMRMLTRCDGAEQGWEVRLEWGAVKGQGPAGCPVGTSVTVTDLFENVPARRKFLRSPMAETGRIKDLISKFILAFPEVRFQLTVDGSESLRSTGTGRLEEAVASVYGAEVVRRMLAVGGWRDHSAERDDLTHQPTDPPSYPSPSRGEGIRGRSSDAPYRNRGYGVEGYVGPPSMDRSNRSQITFFVNRRWVQSRLLLAAVEESYKGLMQQGRYPMAVLNILIPPEEVDVNVHPAKREVRFRNEDRVFSLVQRAVRSALMEASPVPTVHLPTRESEGRMRLSPMAFQAPLGTRTPTPTSPTPHLNPPPQGGRKPEGDAQGLTLKEAAPRLRVLGQASSTYIVAEGPDGIFLIDQHAAHECVLYERILWEMKEGRPSQQSLLEAVMVEVDALQAGLVEEYRAELEAHGFVLEGFGGGSYLLRAAPSVMGEGDPSRGFLEVVEMMSREARVKDRREALAASIACHGSVRAGKGLSQREMEEMVRLLEGTENPHTCPHGRPTMLHLSARHLEREFRRR